MKYVLQVAKTIGEHLNKYVVVVTKSTVPVGTAKKVRQTIDFLLNREEAHNQMFRDAFNRVQDSGSDQDFGTTKAARMYVSLSNPGPDAFAANRAAHPAFRS